MSTIYCCHAESGKSSISVTLVIHGHNGCVSRSHEPLWGLYPHLTIPIEVLVILTTKHCLRNSQPTGTVEKGSKFWTMMEWGSDQCWCVSFCSQSDCMLMASVTLCWLSDLTQRSRGRRPASWRASTNCRTWALTAREHRRRVGMSRTAGTAAARQKPRGRSVCSIETRNEATPERPPTKSTMLTCVWRIAATARTSMRTFVVRAIVATGRLNVINCPPMTWWLETDRETAIGVVPR